MPTPINQLSIRLPPAIRDEIRRRIAVLDISFNQYVVDALQRHLDVQTLEEERTREND